MENREYKVLLADQLIGYSSFEGQGAPEGTVFGVLKFVPELEGKEYNFIKNYCMEHSCEIRNDFTLEKIIATGALDHMKVIAPLQEEVFFKGNHISGMQGDGFDIVLEGISEDEIERLF